MSIIKPRSFCSFCTFRFAFHHIIELPITNISVPRGSVHQNQIKTGDSYILENTKANLLSKGS